MRLAAKEHLLPGKTYQDKLHIARDLGLDGIEINAEEHLVDQIPAIVQSAQALNLSISAIHIGQTHLLHPEFTIRDRSIQRMRTLMSYAIDLGAEAIVFLPFYSKSPVLPDLHPYKSPQELEAELLITQLKTTLCDLAYALGCHMYLQPVNKTETHLIQRIAHAEKIRAKLKNHPHLHIAAHTYHMAKENEPIEESLSQYRDGIGYLYIADENYELSGEGEINFERLTQTLLDINFESWCVLDSDSSKTTDVQAPIKRSISTLKRINPT